MPVWHVSISWLGFPGSRQPRRFADLTPAHLAATRARALDALAGVGAGPNLWHENPAGTIVHLRRRLAAVDLARVRRLAPGFLDGPAVDLAGGEERITPDWPAR